MKKIFFYFFTLFIFSAAAAYFSFQLPASAEGENFSPEISDLVVNNNEGLVLIAGTTTLASIAGSITDNNGCGDLSSVKIAFHIAETPCSSIEDAANSNACYFYEDTSPAQNSSCAGGEDVVYDIDYSFPVFYYADSGDWVAEITATDSAASSSSGSSEVLYIDNLLSVSSVFGVDYGVLAAGTVSQGSNISRIANTGNMELKVLVYGEDLACENGTIPVGNQEFALESFLHGYGASTVLNDYGSFLNVDMPKPSYDNIPVTDDIYWQVSVPQDASGICTGTVYYLATDEF